MSNLEKYKNVFMDSFSINETQLKDNLEYNSIETWDSVGHMGMIASLEEAFEIELETDDIIDFSSFEKGIELLKKYDIKL
jgi:acyl carrier protein